MIVWVYKSSFLPRWLYCDCRYTWRSSFPRDFPCTSDRCWPKNKEHGLLHGKKNIAKKQQPLLWICEKCGSNSTVSLQATVSNENMEFFFYNFVTCVNQHIYTFWNLTGYDCYENDCYSWEPLWKIYQMQFIYRPGRWPHCNHVCCGGGKTINIS